MKTKLKNTPQLKHSLPAYLIGAGMLVAVGIAAGLTWAARPTGNQTKPSIAITTPDPSGILELSQASTKADFTFRLDKVAIDQNGDNVFRPNANHKFIVTDVYFANGSGQQRPVVPVTQVYLKDATGATYYIAPAPMTSPLAAGPLLPNDNLAGQLAFEVPAELKSAKLYFDPGWSNVSPSIYNLNLQ